ncbi:baseplate J/gp47 family protein [Maribacter sp. 2307UL18-2]|uniref:baseplate J/gp47 family protein n=1 Tax=Maribacter sp. 2307UL18-2 TaxID=3386274 RepID=UPI0039BC22AC
MSCGTKIIRDGTNQADRLLKALAPDFFRLDERDETYMLKYVYQLAEQIGFSNENTNQIDGNWQNFFPRPDDTDSFIKNFDVRQDNPVSLALFTIFLRLFKFYQNDINSLTGKQISHYYRDILSFFPREMEPDQVHLIFELSRNVDNFRIAKGTLLNAGKDENNNPIYFSTVQEIVLNSIKIKELKSIFVDQNDRFRIYAAPVANSLDGLGTPLLTENRKWHPFGKGQKGIPTELRTMIEPEVGFVFSSPILLMREGTRNVTLRFRLNSNSDNPLDQTLTDVFEVYFTSSQTWHGPYLATANILTGQNPDTSTFQELLLELRLEQDMPPVERPGDDFDGAFPKTPFPLIKVLFNPNTNQYGYGSLSSVQPEELSINVSVEGLRDVVIQSDQSVLNPDKPFQPFGSQPNIGSNFYIGSTEVFGKTVNQLDIAIQWHDLPVKDLGRHYFAYVPEAAEAYATAITNGDPETAAVDQALSALATVLNGQGFGAQLNNAFQANIALLETRVWVPKLSNQLLFRPDAEEVTTLNMNTLNNSRITSDQEENQLSVHTASGFMRMTLSLPNSFFRAFGHTDYISLLTRVALLRATDPTSEIPFPNVPYTPTIASLSLNYESAEVVNMETVNGVEQLFHIEPFGYREVVFGANNYLFPQFTEEAYFYLGLDQVNGPQNVSIFLQIAESSGDLTVELTTDDIKWEYLVEDDWIQLNSSQILSDSTQGFQTSGIIVLSLPQNIKNKGTILPKDLDWVRASVSEKVQGVNQVIDIRTQAVKAERQINPIPSLIDDQTINNLILKENTITSLKNPVSAIKKVVQPYTSFGGKTKEDTLFFNKRISERLRHKKRAISVWDYEHMVLEKFPGVFKCKCLQHADKSNDFAPGNVVILVISNLLNKNSIDPLRPLTSSIDLLRIKEFLQRHTSPYVSLHVQNPNYEEIKVECKVGFLEGLDKGFYTKLLNDEIIAFLSPWAFEDGKDIVIGGRIHRAEILAFIENLPYVDFITDFNLYHIFSGTSCGGVGDMIINHDFEVAAPPEIGLGLMTIGDDFIVGEPIEIAFASTPRSVLVSARFHEITPLESGEYQCQAQEFVGIGFMAVGIDFEVMEV